MISKYFKELDGYSKEELKSMLDCDDNLLYGILKKLYDNNIIKVTNGKRIFPPADIGKDSSLCKFNFVGLVVISGHVLKCYPKYLPKDLKAEDSSQIKEDLRQVFEVIEKYKKSIKENATEELNDTSKSDSFNLLALMRWFLTDYYDNGIYDNTREIIEINGSGEILWEKTVNETVAVISRKRPYYMELLTKKRVTDTYDYCKRLHEYILTEISKELKKEDLLDLFGLTEVELTDEEREDFGDDGYILYRIEQELNTQFNTRKQLLLRNMYEYFSRKNSLFAEDLFEVYGTTSFNLVWENVCAVIMGNYLDKPLGEIARAEGFKLQPGEWDENTKLTGLMKKVKLLSGNNTPLNWESDEDDSSSIAGEEEKNRLKPDLITIKDIDGERQFIIFDAKYYTPIREDGKTKKLPGVGDITKQYLYQLAYQPFIKAHGLKAKNCFLMPVDGKNVDYSFGTFTLKMLKELLNQMLGGSLQLLKGVEGTEPYIEGNEELEDIQIRRIPAAAAYKRYLENRPYGPNEIKELRL